MLSAWAWLYIERGISFVAERSQEWWNVKTFLRDKRRIRDAAFADPNSTQEHKEAMQQIYQRYCEAAMTLKFAQLKVLKITLAQ